MKEIKTVGIIGAGTMGSGIAQVCAVAGFRTILFDISREMLDKARSGIEKSLDALVEKGRLSEEDKNTAVKNLVYTMELPEMKADLLIEAILEELNIKVKLLGELAAINSKDTILATNTSSIPITRIAAKISNPERVVGIHFFNPAPVMKLVEIIAGAQTSIEVAEASFAFAERAGKVAVMAKDAPGFIVNRVARHYYVEALKLLEENVADHETIDALMEASGFKLGPFRLMDLIGVDTNFSVTSSMYGLFFQDGKFRPSRIQQQKVDAGHHGRKTGKGFYDYEKK
jgi:3-hydroxybutyryl-CoA dehydrogenase